jgi:hypothetical protein
MGGGGDLRREALRDFSPAAAGLKSHQRFAPYDLPLSEETIISATRRHADIPSWILAPNSSPRTPELLFPY